MTLLTLPDFSLQRLESQCILRPTVRFIIVNARLERISNTTPPGRTSTSAKQLPLSWIWP